MKDFIIKKRSRKDYEQFTCRIEVNLLSKIKKIVCDNNLGSINNFINTCLDFAVNSLKIENED